MLRLPLLIAAVTAITAVASPALAQNAIRPGQTVRGELTTSDPTLPDGSHYDCFQVQTRRGQTLQIDQISNAFDSYLIIGSGSCPALTNVADDDDGGDNLNSRLRFDGDGSVLTIMVNSVAGGETGGYQLTVSEAGRQMTGNNAYEGVDPTTLGAARTTTLPQVTSEWGTEVITCMAAYQAMVEMIREDSGLLEFGNVRDIGYELRAARMLSQIDVYDPMLDSLDFTTMNFKSMAMVGAVGIAPNGEPNGGRPLAEYLTTLGNCDRAYGFSPVTTY